MDQPFKEYILIGKLMAKEANKRRNALEHNGTEDCETRQLARDHQASASGDVRIPSVA